VEGLEDRLAPAAVSLAYPSAPPTGGTYLPGGADPSFTFNYRDAAGDVGYGTLNTVASGLGDGSFLATSGSFTLIGSADGNASTGTYALIPEGPAVSISPSGQFIVDDLIYPDNNAASGVNPAIGSNPSFLTYYGLLFGQPGTGPATEINLWGTGSGNYTLYAFTNGSGYNIAQSSSSAFDITSSTLTGFVYQDLNNNGVKDPGEPGIPNTTVTLTGKEYLGNPVLSAATTNSSGQYAFVQLLPSDSSGYTLTETQPAGFLSGKETPPINNFAGTVGPGSSVGRNVQFSDVYSGIVIGRKSMLIGSNYNFGECSVSGAMAHRLS